MYYKGKLSYGSQKLLKDNEYNLMLFKSLFLDELCLCVHNRYSLEDIYKTLQRDWISQRGMSKVNKKGCF